MRAKVLTEAGTFAWHRGDYEGATALHGEALELYRGLGDERGIAFALNCLGVQELEQGRFGRAKPDLEAALGLSRRLGDRRTAGAALHNLAEVARLGGDYERAETLGAGALDVFGEMGDEWQAARMVGWLGMAAVYDGDDLEAASRFLREGLSLIREVGNWEYVAYCLEGFAGLAGAEGEAARAALLYGAAEKLREEIGSPLPPADRANYEGRMAAVREGLEEARLESAWKRGRAMDPQEAVEYALYEEVEQPSPATATRPQEASLNEPMGNLTPREREIASLVAEDLTNRQISARLSISERTAANHVAKILKKLGLRSRVQIASLANETQLRASPRPD